MKMTKFLLLLLEKLPLIIEIFSSLLNGLEKDNPKQKSDISAQENTEKKQSDHITT